MTVRSSHSETKIHGNFPDLPLRAFGSMKRDYGSFGFNIRLLRILTALMAIAPWWMAPHAHAGDLFDSLSQPSLSPDGREIAFGSRGAIWTVSAGGGEARVLVASAKSNSRPLYSPDGKYLAFTSTRNGSSDLYVLVFTDGEIRRLTYDDAGVELDSWSEDSRWIYFSSTAHDIAWMHDVYRVGVGGGTPMPVSAQRYVNEFFAAPRPNSDELTICARGMSNLQWWRNGHSHLDTTEIWLLHESGQYERLLAGDAKRLWPMWTPDGKVMYFMSDRDGSENIWSLQNGQTSPITKFSSGRVLWPSISQDGRFIVFERNFQIWNLQLATGVATTIPIRLLGSPGSDRIERRKMTKPISEFALSPDGKKVVFVVRGQLFAASAKDGGEGVRLTNTGSVDSQITWSSDNRRVLYVSDRDHENHVYEYDFDSAKETRLTNGDGDENYPQFSPDTKLIAFERDRRQIVLFNPATKITQEVATGFLDRLPLASDRPYAWSPDSKWIAFLSFGNRLFRNVSTVRVSSDLKEDAHKEDAHALTYLANVFSNSISWDPNGKFLLMDTRQRTENGKIARIDLVPRLPSFREDLFWHLFQEEAPKPSASKLQLACSDPESASHKVSKSDHPDSTTTSKNVAELTCNGEGDLRSQAKPSDVKISFENIRERLSLLPIGLDVKSQTISPDGKWVAMVARSADHDNVYVYSLDETAEKPAIPRQVTFTAGPKSDVQFGPDSKTLFYLDDAQVYTVTVEEPKPKVVNVSAEVDLDPQYEKIEEFEQSWRWFRDNYYDPAMHGVDWEALRQQYAPRIRAACTEEDVRRLILLMLGELNSSHLGIIPPLEERTPSTGRLGMLFDRLEYENTGRLRITEVVELGPAAVAGVQNGEYVRAINDIPLGPTHNLDQQLQYTINHRTKVTLSNGKDGTRHDVVLMPVDDGKEKDLLHRQWAHRNRQYVERISDGKLGYVHMYDMSSDSLAQFLIDLDAQNQSRKGVVIDLRNNRGGFVNAYALDVLSRTGYMQMTLPGFPVAPARTVLGQRALELPTVLVTNQESISDAEDFAEGYRSLHLGKIVGEPTAGWIIYTVNNPLVDGTELRIPYLRITDRNGHDMEMQPRPVDLAVSRPLGEDVTNKDSQLDVAVHELLGQIEK